MLPEEERPKKRKKKEKVDTPSRPDEESTELIAGEKPKKERKKARWTEEQKEAAKLEKQERKKKETQEVRAPLHLTPTEADELLAKKKAEKLLKKKGRQLAPEERVSGPGNAEEAHKMREAMGFSADEKPSTSSFGFVFPAIQGTSTHDQVEDPKENIPILQANKEPPQSEDGYVAKRVYIGGMPYSTTESEFYEYWSYCGEIQSMDMLKFPDTGRFRGLAYVTFVSEEGYQAALACDGEDCNGMKLKVQKCKSAGKFSKTSTNPQMPDEVPQQHVKAPAAKVAGYNVAYVGNIPYDADEAVLKALFEPYGMTVLRLHTDKDTGRPKGYAHVHFKDEASVDAALTLDSSEVLGRRIRVGYAQPKKT